MRWEIFCKVIDNHGDLGVCWRLACALADEGDTVRLWVDDASALTWMAPHGPPNRVTLLDWSAEGVAAHATEAPPPDVLIEAFGCEPAPESIAHFASGAGAKGQKYHPSSWINLEYLSAELEIERLHGLRSPVAIGPGAGLVKRFFYPGFTSGTGGLIREHGLFNRQATFKRADWLESMGIAWRGERIVTLFGYEPDALGAHLRALSRAGTPTRMLVTPGRSAAAVQQSLDLDPTNGTCQIGRLSIDWLPALSQIEFDHLLWSADLNYVRGEDSLVRALLAGIPLIWQIYPQHDDAHHGKLDAFLQWYLRSCPAFDKRSAERDFKIWNGISEGPLLPIDEKRLIAMKSVADDARMRMAEHPDLVSQLRSMAAQKS